MLMIIAIDGMGGDNSPSCVVEGSIAAIKEFNCEIIIVGKEDLIINELLKYEYDKSKISIINADEVISTNEHPVMAIRKKKNSSLRIAIDLVKENKAEAIISAGSTGALLAGATLLIGRLNGIDRPALAPIMPGKNGPFMLIDVGANAECKPINLLQFAHMGKVYFENVLNFKNPSVGLINIGTEEEKGNELTKNTYQLLKTAKLNFVGNVEPREILKGDIKVLVSDGFVGNSILKTFEGAVEVIFEILKEDIVSSIRTKIGGLLLKPVFKGFKKKFDYKEYGGAAFLGVNGIVIKAHGSSDARAIKNAIHQAIIFSENNVLAKIQTELDNSQSEI